jgi:hypothetical protein
MLYPFHVESLLKFLDIQRKHLRVAVERIALASVREFHFLDKVCFGGPLEPVGPDLDPDNSSSTSDEEVSVAQPSGSIEDRVQGCKPCSE